MWKALKWLFVAGGGALAFFAGNPPTDVVSNLSEWWAWLPTSAARTSLVVIGLAGVVGGLLWILGGKVFQRTPPTAPEPEPEQIPLYEAASRLYEQLRQVDSEHRQIVMAENGRATPDDVINYFAITIAMHTSIFGKRPPSTVEEELPEGIVDRGQFIDGARAFRYFDDREPTFVDLAVRRDALPPILEWVISQNRFG